MKRMRFKYYGVRQIRNGSWMAYTGYAGKQYYFGLYETAEMAAQKHDEKIVELCLPYSKLNYPLGHQYELLCPCCEVVKPVEKFNGKKCSDCVPKRPRKHRSLIPYRNKGVMEFLRVRLSNIKKRCKATGREFDINAQQVFDVYTKQNGLCALCGCSMATIAGQGHSQQTLSVDRINSQQGYVVSNVQLSCFRCNTIKGSLSVSELLDQCRRIIKQSELRNP